MTNFERTANWLAACGKRPGDDGNLTVQVGCHIEEFAEFLAAIRVTSSVAGDEIRLQLTASLTTLAHILKQRSGAVHIPPGKAVDVLDALCDMEVTGNGVAYMAGMNKLGADQAVLASNESKLIDGKPVILAGGKIGKPEGWKPPDLSKFV